MGEIHNISEMPYNYKNKLMNDKYSPLHLNNINQWVIGV